MSTIKDKNLANKLSIDPENIDTIENLKKLLGG